MKEPIAVEARFEVDGNLHPTAFEWNGKRYIIENQGRHWELDGIQHFLVMTAGDQVFELAHLTEDNLWFLSRSAKDFKPHSTV